MNTFACDQITSPKTTTEPLNTTHKTMLSVFKNTNANSKKFICTYPNCKKFYLRKEHLKRHINSFHKIVKYVCEYPDCGKTFFYDGLQKHIRSFHRNKTFDCQYSDCTKKYTTKHQLEAHTNAVHKKTLYHCDIRNCERTFAYKSDLGKHIRKHRAPELVNRFPCSHPDCDNEVFSTKRELFLHTEISHNDRSFECEFKDCKKWYATKQILANHVRIDHEKHRFYCPFLNCDTTFCYKSGLDRHLIDLHNITYDCGYQDCKKTYTSNACLKRHTREHHTHGKVDSITEVSIHRITPDDRLVKGTALIRLILADFANDLRIEEVEKLSNFTELSVREIRNVVSQYKLN